MEKDNIDAVGVNVAGIDIDRNSYEPAYIQLVNIIKRQVASGLMRPGDRLPSESQLCRRYRVSPMTVRRAIGILSHQGIVDTVQGRGTFVKPINLSTATFDLHELQEIFNDPRTRVKILEARIVSADGRAAQKLQLQVCERVIFIRRLLLRGEQPLFYHREYLVYDPTRPVVESELEVTSLRGLFKGEGGSDFKGGILNIEATTINEEEAPVLQAPVGFAAFNLEHIFYDYLDRPVSWGRFICRSDHLRFTTSLGVGREGGRP